MRTRVRAILQAGHSAAYAPNLPGGGGAPGESAWTTGLAGRIATRLRAAGVEVVIVGAWLVYVNGQPVVKPAPAEATREADLFVSLHYDAAIYGHQNSGCLIGRAAHDPQGAAADRFLTLWCATYPRLTGIPLRQDRLNPNITDYYAFRDTGAFTPGVLIEHGVGMGDDHATLYDRRDLIADVDAQVILAYLGRPPQPPPLPTPQEARMLSDAELDTVLAAAWDYDAVAPYNPQAAIAKAYKERLRAGACPGKPASPEMELEDGSGLVYQWFSHGLGIYAPGRGASFVG